MKKYKRNDNMLNFNVYIIVIIIIIIVQGVYNIILSITILFLHLSCLSNVYKPATYIINICPFSDCDDDGARMINTPTRNIIYIKCGDDLVVSKFSGRLLCRRPAHVIAPAAIELSYTARPSIDPVAPSAVREICI